MTDQIPIRVVRFPAEVRNLFRQRARRRAAALGIGKATWRRMRRSGATTLAADMLMATTGADDIATIYRLLGPRDA